MNIRKYSSGMSPLAEAQNPQVQEGGAPMEGVESTGGKAQVIDGTAIAG